MVKRKQYCKKCILHTGDQNIHINENGVCEICDNTDTKHLKNKMKSDVSRSIQFFEYISGEVRRGQYDALLMLSGGKDSMYMLSELVDKYKARIMAFTFDNHFEGETTRRNIEKILEQTGVSHVFYTSSLIAYRKILKESFLCDTNTMDSNEIMSKYPCIVCSDYMRSMALVYAYQMGIPYVLFCADPFQMLSMESDSRRILKKFKDACGEEDFRLIPESQTICEMLEKVPDERMPQIIYPYASDAYYDADTIIEKLKSKQLYDCSRRETHCKLHSLLNYFSIKKFDTYFYSREMAVDVRKGLADREKVISELERFNDLFMRIIEEGEEVEKEMKDVLFSMYGDQNAVEAEYQDIMNIKTIAKTLNINLSQI